MMTEYEIVDGDNVIELSKWVNLLLREGWELRGELIVLDESFLQVLTRVRGKKWTN